MLKRIKLKNSTILFIGLIIILIGIGLGFFEYFKEKRLKAFNEMNILLYENEQPLNIETMSDYDNEPEIPVEEPETPQQQYDYVGILEIPSVNIKQGFVDINSKYNNVNYNITVINGSSYPDRENGVLILAAHSGVCPVCYFDSLYHFKLDGIAYIYYGNIKYTYKVVNIYEVEKNGKVPIYRDNTKNGLVLVTCTRYSNTKQTVYILDLINKE